MTIEKITFIDKPSINIDGGRVVPAGNMGRIVHEVLTAGEYKNLIPSDVVKKMGTDVSLLVHPDGTGTLRMMARRADNQFLIGNRDRDGIDAHTGGKVMTIPDDSVSFPIGVEDGKSGRLVLSSLLIHTAGRSPEQSYMRRDDLRRRRMLR